MKIRKSYIVTVLVAVAAVIAVFTMKISKESKEETNPAVFTEYAIAEFTDSAIEETTTDTQTEPETENELTSKPEESAQIVARAKVYTKKAEDSETTSEVTETTAVTAEETVASEEPEPTTEPVTTEAAPASTTESSETSEESTNDDLYYLAAAIYREAGGESEQVQLLVANVIINRVNSSMYPDTIYGVLTQRGQYGMMWKYGVSFPSGADEATKTQCYSVARRILNGERVCPGNVLFQAEFPQGSGTFTKIGNMYFCYY